MQVTYERCGGLDVHKKSVTACVITPEGKETRTYGTMTHPNLRAVLVRAARAAARTKGTYLSALYHRLAARRGRALVKRQELGYNNARGL